METDTVLAVGAAAVGGLGGVAAAVSAFVLGRRKLRQSGAVADQRLDIQKQRIDLAHHEAIVQGYKDLLQQYQSARDFARKEVHDLRDVVSELSNRVEVLTKNHEKCESENAELKQVLTEVTAELKAVRDELIDLRSNYVPSTSAAPEPPAA